MKKLLTASLIVLLSLTAVQAQKRNIKGSGNVVTLEKTTSDYEGISVSSFFEVELVKGNEGKIILTGEDNIIELIEVAVIKGILTVRIEKNRHINLTKNKNVVVTIPVEHVSELYFSGAGAVSSNFELVSPSLRIETSGARNVSLKINTKKAVISTSGASNLNLDGICDDVEVESSGASNLIAFDLISNDADLNLSGATKVRITANKSIISKVSGAGNVRYRGNPSKVNSKSSGAGSVRKD